MAFISFGRKNDPAHLELGLIHPKLAEPHAALLDDLRSKTGWDLRLRPNPNQAAITIRARQLLPLDWLTNVEPSFHLEKSLVQFKTKNSAEYKKLHEISNEFEQETGFRIAVST